MTDSNYYNMFVDIIPDFRGFQHVRSTFIRHCSFARGGKKLLIYLANVW